MVADILVDEVYLRLVKQLGSTEVEGGAREKVELVWGVLNTVTTRVSGEEGEQAEVVSINQGGHSQKRNR